MIRWAFDSIRWMVVYGCVATVIAEGETRTYDMGGSNTTTEMAAAVAAKC